MIPKGSYPGTDFHPYRTLCLAGKALEADELSHYTMEAVKVLQLHSIIAGREGRDLVGRK